MKLIKQIKYGLAAMLLSFALLGSAPLAMAATQSQQDACAGLSQLSSTTNCNADGNSGVSHLIAVVINILSIIVGIAAVIMIIIGGLRYITSAGDASNAASARSTLIYAVIGLIVVALAQALVHFVLAKTK